jgi:hypothetical protein
VRLTRGGEHLAGPLEDELARRLGPAQVQALRRALAGPWE